MGRSEEDEAQAGSADNGLGTALGAQLAHDGVDVEFDGMVTDAQAVSDSLVGEPFRQEIQHF